MSVETFALRLKDLMETDGYNNTTLGKRLGINRKTIGRWLKEFYFPNYNKTNKIYSIADYINTSF